jgi:hypothetical protein
MHVAVYIEQHPGSPPTVKQHMAAILLVVLAYTFARIGAALNLRVEDYYPSGKWFLLRFKEKVAKRKNFPCTTSSRSCWTST